MIKWINDGDNGDRYYIQEQKFFIPEIILFTIKNKLYNIPYSCGMKFNKKEIKMKRDIVIVMYSFHSHKESRTRNCKCGYIC